MYNIYQLEKKLDHNRRKELEKEKDERMVAKNKGKLNSYLSNFVLEHSRKISSNIDYRVSDFVKRIMSNPVEVPDIDNIEKKYYARQERFGYNTAKHVHALGANKQSRKSLMEHILMENVDDGTSLSQHPQMVRDNSMATMESAYTQMLQDGATVSKRNPQPRMFFGKSFNP